jgi:hypothetical protein
MLAVCFVMGFTSPASAATNLHWKTGTAVTHAKVFSGSTSGNMVCFNPSGYYATMCIRTDRNTMYVRSESANGYFKLGQFKGGGDAYVCQNNHKNSKGNGTWVSCHWSFPKRCYTMRTGYGQADWYELSFDGPIKCL